MGRSSVLKPRNGSPSPDSCQLRWHEPGHDHYLADMNDEENGKNNESDRVCKDCRSYMGSGDKRCSYCISRMDTRTLKRRQSLSSQDEDNDSDSSEDLSRSGSEVLDFQDSETSDSDDSEDEYSSSGEDSKENSPGSKPVHHEKRYRRSAEFIKVNQRPMMEMKPGSNVWYQARIVKERPLEVLVTFPGVTEDEDDTLEWVSKTCGRVWYGDYKMSGWKYLRKGSWRPKASNKQKQPPPPKASKRLPERSSKHGIRLCKHGHPSSSSEKVGSACSRGIHGCESPSSRKDHGSDDEARSRQVIDRGVSHDMNSSHATHSSGSEKGSGKCVDSGHASFATPTAAPSQACPRINLSQDVSPTASLVDGIATQAPALLPSGGDGLEAWFAVHFTRLSESDMFDSHPAGFESLAAAASDNERICSHGCAGPMKPVHQADPAPSTSSLARVSGMLYSSAGDCARTRDVDVSISKHPLKYRKAVLSGGHLGGSSGALQKNHPLRAKMSLKETLKRCGSASPHDSSRNHPSIFAVRSAPKKDQLKGRSASEEPGVNHGKDWKPPKELCHLLDGMFEVRGKDARASNTSSHEKDLPSCTPCDTETNIREKVVTPAESPICNGSTESTKRKHLQVHSKHTLQARLANTGVLKRQLAPSVPLRARGRVLMSDSEDSDSNYS